MVPRFSVSVLAMGCWSLSALASAWASPSPVAVVGYFAHRLRTLLLEPRHRRSHSHLRRHSVPESSSESASSPRLETRWRAPFAERSAAPRLRPPSYLADDSSASTRRRAAR